MSDGEGAVGCEDRKADRSPDEDFCREERKDDMVKNWSRVGGWDSTTSRSKLRGGADGFEGG